jgi:hypothetical protein
MDLPNGGKFGEWIATRTKERLQHHAPEKERI